MARRIESPDGDPVAATQKPDETSLYDFAGSWTGLPVTPDSSDQLVGTTLHDTYVVDRILGEGGMGRVYEARHTRLPNKRFAIKVLHAEFAMNTDLQARFQREAEAAASVNHPGVVGIYDIGRTPQGWQYMVCEYLNGRDLHSHIKQTGPLPLTTVTHIGKRVCEAVEAAHEKGVIHRDLKPHNVFLVGDFSQKVPERPLIKVLDFGLSRFVNQDSELTKTGVVMGTPGYMSPEQAHGRQTDHRTDVYGIGAILYAAAVGRPPFVEDTPQMTVLAVMSREPERPRVVEPSVSEALEVVIQRAMAKDPAERYRDVRELRRALGSLDAPAPSMMPPPRARSEPAASPHEARAARLRLALLLAAATVLVLAALTSVVLGALSLRGTELALTTTERVLLVALVAMFVFPTVLVWRQFQRRVWSNSARVVDWLRKLRTPVFTGVFAYGLAALIVRVLDELIAGFGNQALLGRAPGVAYRGYSIVLPLVGLLGAAAAVAHGRWWRARHTVRRLVFGPILTGATAVCSLSLLYSAVLWRASEAPPALAAERRAKPASEAPAQAKISAAAANTSTQKKQRPDKTASRARDDALAAAIAEGSDSLAALAKRYPEDPELMKALFMAYASKANTLVEALQTAKRLLAIAPERRLDPDLRYIIGVAAERKGAASALAFELMSDHMGSAGADLLYDLLLKKPALETRAKKALADARREQKFSSALAIAYDLRFAQGCPARLALLPRALELGDERSVLVLTTLVSKPANCRKARRGCRAQCEKEAPAFEEAIDRIKLRLRTSSSK